MAAKKGGGGHLLLIIAVVLVGLLALGAATQPNHRSAKNIGTSASVMFHNTLHGLTGLPHAIASLGGH
jgi:hypothetical protein